ncbi:hypothetical protein GCM10027589_46720 [Actinocorallia lasiicapitis]
MDFSSIPKPDDLLVAQLREFSGPGWVLATLFAVYFLVKAWIDAVVLGHRTAGRLGRALRTIASTGPSMAAGALIAAVGTGVVIVAWLVLSTALANFMGRAVRAEAFGLPEGGGVEFADLLRLPPYSDNEVAAVVAQYVLWSGVIIAAAGIVGGFRRSSAAPFAFLLAPWLIIAVFTGLYTITLGIGALFVPEEVDPTASHAPDDIGGLDALGMLLVTAAIVGYVYAGALIGAAPAWTREVWTAAVARQRSRPSSTE